MPISTELAREIFLIQAWHIGALVFLFWVNGVIYRNALPGVLKNSYLILQGLLYIWIIAKMLKTVAPSDSLRWGFIVLQYAGVSFIGPAYFIFSWIYRFKKVPSPKAMYGMLFVSMCFFVFIAFNPYHHLFYATYDFYQDTFGKGYYLFIAYQYTLLGLAVIINIWGVLRSAHSDVLLAVVALPSVAFNMLYSFGFVNPLFDITPILMSVSLVVFGFAAFKGDFIGVLPMARLKLIQWINDPIVVTYCNTIRKHIMNQHAANLRKGSDNNGSTSANDGTCTHEMIVWSHNFPPSQSLATEFCHNDHYYTLLSHKKKNRFQIRHYIDSTEIKKLQSTLQAKSLELQQSLDLLEKENQQNMVAIKNKVIQHSQRTVHDILGHSLTVVLCRLRQSKHNTIVANIRKEATSILNQAYVELQSKLQAHQDVQLDAAQSISIALQPLIRQSLDVVTISYYQSGSEYALPSSLVDELYQCTREAITNALKHGKAQTIQIMVGYQLSRIKLWIVDDGIGCSSVHFGSGLSLMEQGLVKWNGVLRCAFEAGKGFQVTITVPINQ
jgi:signal transduction histidine kinase